MIAKKPARSSWMKKSPRTLEFREITATPSPLRNQKAKSILRLLLTAQATDKIIKIRFVVWYMGRRP